MIKTGNVSSVFGRWLNTNRDTPTIAECTVSQDKDGIAVQVIPQKYDVDGLVDALIEYFSERP